LFYSKHLLLTAPEFSLSHTSGCTLLYRMMHVLSAKRRRPLS
jgi:hypothetical protein